MGKAFEKQTKTIDDQGEKQINAIQDNKEQTEETEIQLHIYDDAKKEMYLITLLKKKEKQC